MHGACYRRWTFRLAEYCVSGSAVNDQGSIHRRSVNRWPCKGVSSDERLSPPHAGTLDGAPLLTMDGESRSPNIFWAGAINPAWMGHRHGRTLDERSPPSSLQADFVVRELPLSLQQLVLDYDSLSPEQERDFLFALFSGAGNHALAHQRDARVFELRLVRVVLACQAHVRTCALWRVHVSIRDIMRALKLYGVLLQVRRSSVDHRRDALQPPSIALLHCSQCTRKYSCQPPSMTTSWPRSGAPSLLRSRLHTSCDCRPALAMDFRRRFAVSSGRRCERVRAMAVLV